jgi:hypothetical protein
MALSRLDLKLVLESIDTSMIHLTSCICRGYLSGAPHTPIGELCRCCGNNHTHTLVQEVSHLIGMAIVQSCGILGG